jgi:hypothetical protein
MPANEPRRGAAPLGRGVSQVNRLLRCGNRSFPAPTRNNRTAGIGAPPLRWYPTRRGAKAPLAFCHTLGIDSFMPSPACSTT